MELTSLDLKAVKSYLYLHSLENSITGMILGQLAPILQWNWTLAVSFVVALTCLITFSVTSIRSAWVTSKLGNRKAPPVLPYWIPFLGSIVSFLFDGPGLGERLVRKYGYNVPAGLRLGPSTLYFLSNPQHAHIFFRQSPDFGTAPILVHVMKHVLGTPPGTLPLYAEDDSGPLPRPNPGTCIKPENRIRFQHMKAAHDFLGGLNNGIQLSERYAEILRRNLSTSKNANKEWIEHSDLYAFLQRPIFLASTEALMGSEILNIVPNLAEDFWSYDAGIPTLMKTIPRWLAPGAHKARDTMLEDVKKWHAHAKAHSDFNSIESQDPDWDPYFGTKYVKARQKAFHDIKIMDADARAAEDVGLLFAASANSVKATFWLIFEVFTRPKLLARVREIARLVRESRTEESEVVAFGNDHLLQSMFAEITRLRVVGIVAREVVGDHVTVGEWSLPKDSFVGLYSRTAGMNSEVWNTGTVHDPHPIETFWEERFLVYPRETGNHSEGNKQSDTSTIAPPGISPRKLVFSLRGLSSVYVPFGGGVSLCPGRQFARYEAINTLVEYALNYDIDCQIPPGWEPKMHTGFFPTGTLPPADAVPFRIRQRQ